MYVFRFTQTGNRIVEINKINSNIDEVQELVNYLL